MDTIAEVLTRVYRDILGRPTVFGAVINDPVERGRPFVVAVVLDTTWQLLVFRRVYPGEVLLIAVACAIVPSFLVRGPLTRLLRLVFGKRS
jgi:hypothetical protein